MSSCSYCNSFILFGGRTDQTGRYCNEKCQQSGNLLAFSHHLPRQEIDRRLEEFRHASCPRCGGPGPVDVHKAHRVWSALILTSWSSSPELSCKSCATKRQLGAMLFSGCLGWWGFPWGIIMTPVQVARNISEMVGGPKPGQPSPLLEKVVRLQAGAQLAQSQARAAHTPPPPIIPARSTPPPLPAANDDARYMPKS